MTLVEALTAARNKIASGWTTGAMARNKDGSVVDYDSPFAERFCVLGAVGSLHLAFEPEREVLLALEKQIPSFRGIVTFNDSGTQQKVLDLFDETIKANS